MNFRKIYNDLQHNSYQEKPGCRRQRSELSTASLQPDRHIRLQIWVMAVLLLAGCAGPQLSPDSPSDPTSAQAPESAAQVGRSSLTDDTTRAIAMRLQQTSAAGDHATGSNHGPVRTEPPVTNQPEGALYTCPMHPEVQQNKPGDCPKCGMALIEK